MLENGRTVTVEASSEIAARDKYFGSSEHFRTEVGIAGIAKRTFRKLTSRKRKKEESAINMFKM